ncbi:hypothetical protein EMGBS15_16470 [Filimonas sp.]|nr:hypothetical protein EMGBS15_16470 [Filimonas sp.]
MVKSLISSPLLQICRFVLLFCGNDEDIAASFNDHDGFCKFILFGAENGDHTRMQENVILYNAKINELIDKNTRNGLLKLVREEKLPSRSNIDLMLHINCVKAIGIIFVLLATHVRSK